MKRLLFLALCAAVTTALAVPGEARAHAVVVETSPADGAVLDVSPGEIVIRFNEPVGLIATRFVAQDGSEIAAHAHIEDSALRIALPPGLGDGIYVTSYRVISVDSHPVGGSIAFTIGTSSGRAPPPGLRVDDRTWWLAMASIRTVITIGILGGAGSVLFLMLVLTAESLQSAAARIEVPLAALGSAAALLSIGVQGGLLTAGGAHVLLDPATWRLGLASNFGRTAVAATAGLALVALGLSKIRSPFGRGLATVGAVVALSSFALSGHVVPAGPRWLTVPLLLVHAATAAFWVGALLPLRQVVRDLGQDSAPIVERFSWIALCAVPILVVAGLIITVLQVSMLHALFSTAYGAILLTKVGLVAALLGLAALNKLRLTPSLARGDPGAAKTLERTILAEVGLVLAIILATAALGTTPPPRALEATDEGIGAPVHDSHHHHAIGLSVAVTVSGRRADIAFTPGHSGMNTAEIAMTDEYGTPLNATEVTIAVANTSAALEPIERTAHKTSAGRWRVESLPLVAPGEWTIRVQTLVSDFERVTFETMVNVP